MRTHELTDGSERDGETPADGMALCDPLPDSPPPPPHVTCERLLTHTNIATKYEPTATVNSFNTRNTNSENSVCYIGNMINILEYLTVFFFFTLVIFPSHLHRPRVGPLLLEQCRCPCSHTRSSS